MFDQKEQSVIGAKHQQIEAEKSRDRILGFRCPPTHPVLVLTRRTRASVLPRFGGAVGIYPGQWCPASAQPCEHASHLGFEAACDVPHGRLRLFLVTREFLPLLIYSPKPPFSPSLSSPHHGHPHMGIVPPTASLPWSAARRVRLSLYPGYPSPYRLHLRMGKNGTVCPLCSYCCFHCLVIACGYVAVGYARLRQGAERDWSNPKTVKSRQGRLPGG